MNLLTRLASTFVLPAFRAAVLLGLGLVCQAPCGGATLSLEGIHVVPHVQSSEMKYRRNADFSLGARVEVFLRNTSAREIVLPSTSDVRLRGRTPSELLQADEWAWHDLPSAWGGEPLRLPPGALTAWSWNGKRALWGTNTQAELSVAVSGENDPWRAMVPIDPPVAWLSAVTYLGASTNVQPDTLIFHVANRGAGPLRVDACRLWLPENNATWRALLPEAWISNRLERFPADGVIPSNDRGGARVATGPLPLTYMALEVRLTDAKDKPVTV